MVYSLTRSYYEPLIRAGVRIYEYTPGFIHAKSYLVDDRIGIVGTINMDYRSLYLHMECAAMLVECSALQKMKLDCVVTIEKSRPCDASGLQASPAQSALAGDPADDQPASVILQFQNKAADSFPNCLPLFACLKKYS